VEDVWNLLAVADVAFTEVELTPPLEGEGVVEHVPVHDRTVAIQRSTHVAGGTREDKIRPEAEISELLVSEVRVMLYIDNIFTICKTHVCPTSIPLR